MSMLKCFFDIDSDKSVFEGLAVSGETIFCEKYMGKFPTVFISLKGINGDSYEMALAMAVRLINELARKYQYLLDSKRLTKQIEERHYEQRLCEEGMLTILKYGIACHKKQCRVAMEQ